MSEQDEEQQQQPLTAEQLMQAWNQVVQPIADVLKQMWGTISRAVQTVAKGLQRLGHLPPTKRIRRPKQRSRLRHRVALKRKGLWMKSVWA